MTIAALPQPYLLFLGDVGERAFLKTALGLADWASEHCIGEYRLPGAAVTTGLPAMAPVEARAGGARAMVIGAATPGGGIPDSWIDGLLQALGAGLDIVSGMHVPLSSIARLAEAAERQGRQLIDVRRPPNSISVASGAKRTGNRLLTVGTDCALGKKYTALAIDRAFRRRGIASDFRATGQTGILIAGRGMPMDAVVADFCAGAAEMLTPDAADDHWDVIEGQGSLFHPSYAGVSLALLHGSQPDVVVVCHEPGRRNMVGAAGFALPTVEEAIETNLLLARRVNPQVRCAGVSFNTSALSVEDAERLMETEGARLGLPVADPVRGGPAFDRLVSVCLGQ